MEQYRVHIFSKKVFVSKQGKVLYAFREKREKPMYAGIRRLFADEQLRGIGNVKIDSGFYKTQYEYEGRYD